MIIDFSYLGEKESSIPIIINWVIRGR